MTKFSKEKVLLLHQIMAEATGGSIGVRDEALLESALESAFPAMVTKNSIRQRKKRAHDLATH